MKTSFMVLMILICGLIAGGQTSSAELDLAWSTLLGGSQDDIGSAIALDKRGHLYIAGHTKSVNFPTTPGAFDGTLNGAGDQSDIFIVKLDPSGSGLVYATYLGGSLREDCEDIALDGSNNLCLTGTTWSTDFPVTAGAFDTDFNGGAEQAGDAFVTKLNFMGTGLIYSTYLGGSRDDRANCIALDGAEDIYLAGETRSTDFPVTDGAFSAEYGGGNGDAFVLKLDVSGSVLEYSTFLGGEHTDRGRDIAVDGSGQAYVTGYTYLDDFPTTPGAFDSTYGGTFGDAFVTKFDPQGSRLIYSTRLGGTREEDVSCIALDPAGNTYLAGVTNSYDFPTTSEAHDRTPNHSQESLDGDAFVSKLNPEGSALVYSTYLGGSGLDYIHGIALDAAGSAYLCGSTDQAGPTAFPTTPGAFDSTHNGRPDAFFSQLGPRGSKLVYSTFLGGAQRDRGNDILLDDAGNVFLVGYTESTDFPTISKALRTVHHGLKDVFVARFGAGAVSTEPVAQSGAVPRHYALLPNYPNPFNASTVIRFNLPRDIRVALTIYDTLGRQVRQLANRTLRAGAYTISWNGLDDEGKQMNSGVYFTELKAGSFEEVIKMVMMR